MNGNEKKIIKRRCGMGNENNREDKSLPLFEIPFSRRVEEGWRHFLEEEAELRRLIDGKREGDEIGEQLEILLCPIFTEVYAEVGFHEGKYDLILNLEGDWSRLFPLVYFKKQAPKEVLEHWNILVGRQARDEESGDFQLRIEEEKSPSTAKNCFRFYRSGRAMPTGLSIRCWTMRWGS